MDLQVLKKAVFMIRDSYSLFYIISRHEENSLTINTFDCCVMFYSKMSY